MLIYSSKLGTYLPESSESRKKRMNSNEKIVIDSSCIYSFSVNTTNLHLPTWSIVRIPMLNKLDMRKLIGDADVRLVAYELPCSTRAMTSKHPRRELNYVFSLNLQSVDPLKETDTIELNSDDDDGGDDEDDEEEEEDVNVDVDASKIERDDDDDDDDEEDAQTMTILKLGVKESNENRRNTKKVSKRQRVRNWFQRGIKRMVSSSSNLAQVIRNREFEVEERR